MPLHLFGSKSTISRFGERFRNGQYSLVSFLLAVVLLTVLPAEMDMGRVHPWVGLDWVGLGRVGSLNLHHLWFGLGRVRARLFFRRPHDN